jgi:hypothetical protein
VSRQPLPVALSGRSAPRSARLPSSPGPRRKGDGNLSTPAAFSLSVEPAKVIGIREQIARIGRQMSIIEEAEPGAFPPNFHHVLGQFHCMWMMFDVTLDFAIKKLLGISDRQAHIMCTGMEFGKKLRLLSELLKNGDADSGRELLSAGKILQSSKRDALTHGYIASNSTHVTFVYRNRGSFTVDKYEFTIEEFQEHVAKMVKATIQFQKTLAASEDELTKFANSAG